MSDKRWTIDSITRALDEHVVGQPRAKDVLAAAAVSFLEGSAAFGGRPVPLLAGKSGTGKTLLVSTLAERVMRVPWVAVDASQLVPEGYVGVPASMALEGVFTDSEYSSSRPLGAICLVDELDKLGGATGEPRFRRHAESSLLKLFEGAPVVRSSGPFGDAPTRHSTHNVLFVAAGSFHDVRMRVRAKRLAGIGFAAPSANDADPPLTLADVRAESGLLPELVNRLTACAVLEDARLEDLVTAARRSTTLRAFVATMRRRGVEVAFGASFFHSWAEAAAASPEGGFRALASELNGVMARLLRARETWRAAEGPVVLTARDFAELRGAEAVT